MVSPNSEHVPPELASSNDSVRRRMLCDSVATRRQLNPGDTIWFERPAAIREPEWFELPDEFE